MAELDELATSQGLSAYDAAHDAAHDAAYLELAIRGSLPIATLDAAMRKAMQAARVELAVC